MESINIWKKGLPIEFQLVGVKKEKFTIKDVIFFDTCFSFAMAQKQSVID
jgi:hypothetical protein